MGELQDALRPRSQSVSPQARTPASVPFPDLVPPGLRAGSAVLRLEAAAAEPPGMSSQRILRLQFVRECRDFLDRGRQFLHAAVALPGRGGRLTGRRTRFLGRLIDFLNRCR